MESSIAEGRAPATPGRVPLKDRYGNVRAWALVDAEDLERVNAYGRWSLKVQKVGPGYARRAARGEPVLYLHRIVMGVEPGDAREVDHISRDTLDNRKSNLRLCTHAQNRQNTKGHDNCTSQHRGVSWDKERRKWKVQVKVDGRNRIIGRYADEDEAARAAVAARRELMPYSMT
jgi:hypothetical protein